MLPFVLHNLNLENLKNTEISSRDEFSLYPGLPNTDHSSIMDNSSTVGGPFFNKHLALRVTVGVTCFLSMLGATVIILSYFLIRDIQTKSRQILVHLSFADFGVACSNFIGVAVYFDQYIRHCPTTYSSTTTNTNQRGREYGYLNSTNSGLSCSTLKGLCTTQAFFAGFSTLASVLWTLFLAVYIYCLVVHSSKRVHHKVLYLAYVLCWGLPLFISLWLIGTDRLGYSPHGGSGWCTLKVDDSSGRQDTFAVVFGNDLWIYLTFIMVTLLYFTTHCYIKFQLRESNPYVLQGNNMATVSKADTKFILIPFFFLLLRMWTMILVILLVYAHVSPPRLVSCVLLYAALMVACKELCSHLFVTYSGTGLESTMGIGDSGQGFVNSLLFCVFTPKVRKQFILLVLNSRCLKRQCPLALTQASYSPESRNSLSSTFPVMRSKPRKCVTSSQSDAQSDDDTQEQPINLLHNNSSYIAIH